MAAQRRDEPDKVRVGRAKPIPRMVPVSAMARTATDHDRHVRGGHHPKVCDGLHPGEAVSFGSQECCGAVIMAALAEHQGREEDLLEGFPVVAARRARGFFP